MPVITIREENTWSDAYNQYVYNKKYQNRDNIYYCNSSLSQNGEI
jgi:hypothetical protein